MLLGEQEKLLLNYLWAEGPADAKQAEHRHPHWPDLHHRHEHKN